MVGEVGVVEGMKGWGRGQESEQMADIAHTAPLSTLPHIHPSSHPSSCSAGYGVVERREGGGN